MHRVVRNLWSGCLSAAAVALAALLLLPGSALADHAFLPNYFPLPVPREKKDGPPPPTPLLPENALTGYESAATEFKDACGLAFDTEEHMYISDHYHHVVDEYGWIEPENKELKIKRRVFGPIAEIEAPAGPCGLAFRGNRLYVNDYHRGVWLYQGLLPVYFDQGPATGVAVDPSTGRVYVTHQKFVAVYDASGNPVMEGAEPLEIGVGALGDAYGAAVSRFSATSGYLYVADAADETVKVFNPAVNTTTPVQVIDGSLGPQQGFRDLRDAALAVDQSNGNLLVTDRLAEAEEPPIVVDEFTPQGNFRGQLPHALSGGEPAGIAVNPVNHDIFVTTGRRERSGVYAFGPATPTHPLLVTKGGAGQGTVATTPVGISCPADCAAGEAEFASGSLVALRAEPAPHSTFEGWVVAGQPGACPGTGVCQVQLSAAREVSAEFGAIPQQTLEVALQGAGSGSVTTEPAGIECGEVCSEHFDQGSTVTLTATPAAHSHLAGWSVAGNPSACAGAGACQVTLDQDTQVTADFATNPDRSLSVSISGPGRIVSSPGGIDCTSSCGHSFPDGSSVTLEAQPADGYELVSWSGACSGKRRCSVAMDGDQSVGATFARIEDALAISVVGTGTGRVSDPADGIDCGLTCAGIFKRGSVLKLTAKAEKGSRFVGFSGCDQVSGATCTVTVTDAKTVTATFGEAPEIEVRRVTVRGAKAVLAVYVPAPGLLQTGGRGLVNTKLRARSEGVVLLHLSLSKKGKSMLRKTKEGKLSIHVGIRFTSADGSKTNARKIVTFKGRAGR